MRIVIDGEGEGDAVPGRHDGLGDGGVDAFAHHRNARHHQIVDPPVIAVGRQLQKTLLPAGQGGFLFGGVEEFSGESFGHGDRYGLRIIRSRRAQTEQQTQLPIN
jgi:hypothetical protein